MNSTFLRMLSVVLAILWVVPLGYAQEVMSLLQQDHTLFERFSGEDGLPGSAITGIAQDHKGFLWIGTDDGLVKYDGYTFTVFRHDPHDPYSLSYDQISVVYKDQAGRLWIGTKAGGLNRLVWETEQFVRYQHNPQNTDSLSDDHVLAIHEDRAGRLWVATLSQDINVLQPDGETFAHYSLVDNASDSTERSREDDVASAEEFSQDKSETMKAIVYAIFENQDGTLWFITPPTTVLTFDEQRQQFSPTTVLQAQEMPEKGAGHLRINTLHAGPSGTLWVGTMHGVYQVEPDSGDVRRYEHTPSDAGSLSDDQVNVLYYDSAGRLWIGTHEGGLNRFDEENETFIHYAQQGDLQGPGNNSISVIYEDSAGGIWVGTDDGGGLYRFHPDRARFSLLSHFPDGSAGLTDNQVTAIFEGASGTLWVGYQNDGFDRLDMATGSVMHYEADPKGDENMPPDGLPHNSISAILEDRAGSLWIGTQGRGLVKFNPDTEDFQQIDQQPSFTQNSQSPLSGDSPPDNHEPLIGHFISTLYEDRDGMLWIGTLRTGLYLLNPKTEDVVRYQFMPEHPEQGMSSSNISAITQDAAGILWIGTMDGGLNALDPKTGQITQYQNSPNVTDCLSNNAVWSIHEDATGMLWIGTSSGLNAFDRAAGTFDVYRRSAGLPSDVIYGIVEKEATLWLSTNNGLARFYPQTGAFQSYDTGDGLQSNVFNPNAYHKGRSGLLYFGGQNGLNAFSADRLQHNRHVPPIAITEFQMFNQMIRPGQPYNLPIKRGDSLIFREYASPLEATITETTEIVLSYKEDTLAFEFAALDFMAPEKNQYAYIMEGFDEDWTYAGTRRFVQYTNLPAGNYLFRVKGSNNDGVWNEAGVMVALTIRPAFWQTLWFRALFWIAVIGLVALAYILRMRRITAQKRKLELLVQQRTQELEEHTIRLEDEIIERTRAENQLRDTHEELKTTLENLQRTQAELIQSEKMAALGQLIAGIAHEINTPLGAIRASIGNISQSLLETIQQLPALFQQLSSDQHAQFWNFVNRGLDEKKQLTSREERKLRRALQKELDALDVEHAEDIADTLVDMGIYTDIDSLVPLLVRQDAGDGNPLKTAYNLSMQQHHSRNIETAIERASKIVFALKRYAHYGDAGELVEADIKEGIDDVLTLYHNQLKQGIEVNVHYDEIPRIRCYPDELNQVWTNLLHNAIQAMKGKGTLDIHVAAEQLTNTHISISITDSGCGIAEEVKARIFEPFFTTKSAGEGSGLGLDICRQIIEKHQGRITFESQPGQTTFTVFLPIA